MITSVSFRAENASNFQSKIAQPPKYARSETPSAATKINGKNKKGGSIVKTGLIIAGAGAALAALIALGHKCNLFAIKECTNENIGKIKGGLDSAGKFLCEKTSSLLEKFTKKAVE